MQLDPLLLAIAVPLAVAAAIFAGLPKRYSVRLAYLGFGAPAAIALWLWSRFPANAGEAYQFMSSRDLGLSLLGIKLTLGLNGISLPLFVLAGVVGLAAGLYAIQSGAERLKIYLALLLVMQGGLMGVFASVDVFFFYFFHELALIPSFIMVGIWGGRDRGYAAMKLTIYLTVGAMLTLAGLILIYHQSGAQTFDLITLRAEAMAHPLSVTAQKYGFGLLLFGFVFAVNSSVHSYLILAFGSADRITRDVGFYYMANAAGRLLGTLLSGLSFQLGGLPLCLATAGVMAALSWWAARRLGTA
jgi:NADH-quinone oxidoreductase subunit M